MLCVFPLGLCATAESLGQQHCWHVAATPVLLPTAAASPGEVWFPVQALVYSASEVKHVMLLPLRTIQVAQASPKLCMGWTAPTYALAFASVTGTSM